MTTNGLLAAADRVVRLRESTAPLSDWTDALDDLATAVTRERERNRTRVARMRARRKEKTDV